MSDSWYRFSAMRPPLTVKVRVMWHGRELIAARAKHPEGHDLWGAYRSQTSEYPTLVTLNGEPDLWQPLYPESWRLALPEPVTPSEDGRMVRERARFALVDDAEAVDLAREMEADRESARTSRDDAPRGRQVEVQWWRDHTLITYERPPNVSLRMVEGRLMRAVACCGINRIARESLKTSQLLAEIGGIAARAIADIEAVDWIPRFNPLPADEDDFLTAMAWFAGLYPPEARPKYWSRLDGIARFNRPQKVVFWRALNIPLSFAEIGAELKLSGERARQVFHNAIESSWRIANGFPREA